MARGKIDWVAVRQQLEANRAALERTMQVDHARLRVVLDRRAEQLATRNRSAPSGSPGTAHLIFAAGMRQFAVQLSSLSEILPFSQCTPVPGAGEGIVGVVNCRGRIVSVVAFSRIAGIADDGAEANRYLIRLRASSGTLLLVDALYNVRWIADDEVLAPQESAGHTLPLRARGLTTDGVVVVDAGMLIQHPLFGETALENSELTL